MSRKKKPGIFALLKEKILGEPSAAAAKAGAKKQWDAVATLPFTGGESPEEALENELAHELGVAYDVYGRVSRSKSVSRDSFHSTPYFDHLRVLQVSHM